MALVLSFYLLHRMTRSPCSSAKCTDTTTIALIELISIRYPGRSGLIVRLIDCVSFSLPAESLYEGGRTTSHPGNEPAGQVGDNLACISN